ncbi:MAG: hypothetical protein QM538_04610 [Methylacidiphilales bacterium]|nr:hypothetical protein [Candidatus Methylacidiphilales bacterium]
MVLSACTVGTTIIGRWIDPLSLEHLQNGVTSEDKILYYFGRPDDEKETKYEKLMTYRYCELHSDGVSKQTLQNTDPQSVCDFLKITIDKETMVMRSHTYIPHK